MITGFCTLILGTLFAYHHFKGNEMKWIPIYMAANSVVTGALLIAGLI